MSTCQQFACEQRYQINAFLDTDTSQEKIAVIIGVSPSTISPELKHHRSKRGYRPKQTHEKALSRRKAKKRISAMTWSLVQKQLREDWSPEQIQ